MFNKHSCHGNPKGRIAQEPGDSLNQAPTEQHQEQTGLKQHEAFYGQI